MFERSVNRDGGWFLYNFHNAIEVNVYFYKYVCASVRARACPGWVAFPGNFFSFFLQFSATLYFSTTNLTKGRRVSTLAALLLSFLSFFFLTV